MLPVLFVCEDNGVAAFTRADSVTAGPGVTDRAKALGVAAITVDGNNVMSVDDAAQVAVAAVRRGEGPHLLHVRTYRITGHTSTDAAAWRPEEEVAAARARDPIARLGAVLAERGVLPSQLGKIIDEAKAEMATARKEANQAAWPEPHVAYEDVQDTGACGVVEVTLIEASRRAALQEMRRDARVWVLGEGRRARRPVGPVPGFSRRVRRAARRLHADLGVDHHGRGARLGAGRHASDHRDAHLRFRDVRDG